MDIQEITQRVEKESLVLRQIMAEIEKVVVGQRNLMERMLIGLLCNGHLLHEAEFGDRQIMFLFERLDHFFY